ncbi:hypothetical protein BDV93DRAFT_454139, partial [Ceratobasidium sp. AG-I]
TVSTLMAFFVAMLLFPDVQANTQSEIDTVIGTDRLPDFNDQEQLPYVGRVVQEVLRWFPMSPLGKYHMNAVDS